MVLQGQTHLERSQVSAFQHFFAGGVGLIETRLAANIFFIVFIKQHISSFSLGQYAYWLRTDMSLTRRVSTLPSVLVLQVRDDV